VYTSVKNFNPYENELDHQDLYGFPPNEQTVDINEIGYIINPGELSQNAYYELDNSQSSILTYEVEQIAETWEEILQKPFDVSFTTTEVKCSIVSY